jgi:hypothetical protein
MPEYREFIFGNADIKTVDEVYQPDCKEQVN